MKTNEAKMVKIKEIILNLSNNQLLDHRDHCLAVLDSLPAPVARGHILYQVLLAIEIEMDGRGRAI